MFWIAAVQVMVMGGDGAGTHAMGARAANPESLSGEWGQVARALGRVFYVLFGLRGGGEV